jgi:outer membrane protein assembly factor BamD (BamD/ComL family)
MPEQPTAISTATPIASAYSSAAQLDAERALLDDARHALTHGDAARAVEDLRSHERAYTKPLLGEEHDALLVEALVRAGRYDEARTKADAFRRKTPGSLFMSAVDAAIASIP